MNARSRCTTVGALLIALVVGSTQLLAKPLPNDSRIRSGKLGNGATWMYRQHDNPPGKMALMIHVRSGSLNETESQRGLAHFVEHMGFNGTENFAPGDLIPYFESIGMEFGADLNAFTSFDQTVYMLFTPDTEVAQVDKALMVLSDYAFRALMLLEEIDKERGIVLEESRRGKNAFQRIRDKLWPKLFEGSRFARRLPIGDDDIIANAPRKEFVDYYRTWYRPENVTLVLVGDASLEPFLPSIKKWFGQYKPTAPAREAKSAEFKPFTLRRALIETDPEMAFCQLQMFNIRRGRPATTTTEMWRRDLVEDIGTWILDRRYDERVKKGEASYRNANAFVDNFFHDGLLTIVSATGEPQDWEKMLMELVIEAHRAGQFGFTERELDLAKKELLADARRAVKTEPTRNARRIARRIVATVNEEEPILSAQQKLDLHEQFLPTVDLAEVNTAFEQHFSPGTFAYVVTMVDKEGVVIPEQDDVLAVARKAWAHKVTPTEEKAAPTTLLATLPEPGHVAERTFDEDLQITSAWLSNGVRVRHRFMDYKKDSVFVSVSLAGGSIEETTNNAGITEAASLTIKEAATNRLSSTDLRDIMTGKNINVSVRSAGDSLTLQITGSPEDLEIGLQKVHALLTDGKLEASAFKNWKLSSLQRIEMMAKMPMFKAFEAMAELLGGGDPRITPMTKKKVEAQTLASAQQWFDRLCREAPIEVAVVGDISLETAMPLMEKYLGSLPKRTRSAKHLNRLRKLPRSTGPLNQHVKVETVTPQAMAIAGFIGCEGRNTTDRRAMELAAHILTSRAVKRIREDLSIVYSIRAQSSPSWIYADSGRMMASAPCDPKNVDRVVDEVFTLFQAFADDGPTQEELDNAKKQIANNLDTQMREPRYWWRILQHYDLHGRDLEVEKSEKQAFDRYTVEQVRNIFGKYHLPTRQFRVTAVPTTPAGE